MIIKVALRTGWIVALSYVKVISIWRSEDCSSSTCKRRDMSSCRPVSGRSSCSVWRLTNVRKRECWLLSHCIAIISILLALHYLSGTRIDLGVIHSVQEPIQDIFLMILLPCLKRLLLSLGSMQLRHQRIVCSRVPSPPSQTWEHIALMLL